MGWGMIHIRTIKGRLLWYNFCVVCVVGVLLSVSSYVTANRRAVEVATNSLQYHVESISYRYQLAYDEMINIILNCTEQGTFDLKQIGRMENAVQRKNGLKFVSSAGNYCTIAGYGSYIRKLSIFSDEGSMVQTGTSLGSTDDWERIMNASWFEKESEKAIERYRLELREPLFYGEKEQSMPIIHEIAGTGGHQWAALFLNPRLFQDELVKNDNGSQVLVYASDGERVAAIHERQDEKEENDNLAYGLLASEELQGVKAALIHGRDCRIAWQKQDKSGILVLEVLDLRDLKHDRRMLFRTVALIFAACVSVGLLLSYLFSRQMEQPIRRLVSHINRIAEGDFSRAPELESEDEIGRIGKVVNSMADQIDRLMKQRMEDEKEKSRLMKQRMEDEKEKSRLLEQRMEDEKEKNRLMEQRMEDEKEKSRLELKMLQAQINPHFLYNTLDSIKWIAVIQKNSGIVKVVTALSGLLKNMAKGFNEKVTVGKELEFVRDYVTIEKMKYVEMFDVKIRVDDPALEQARIIKLTLQPLVENAIFSGIEPGGKSGTILIHVYGQDGRLYLVVRDDGVGIAPERIDGLLKDKEKLTGDRMSGIGLANVDRRIKLTYGDEYGLSIASEEGSYTEITVAVPLEMEETGED